MAKNNEYEYLSKQRIQLIIDLDNAQKKLNESIEEGTASAEELSKAYASVGSVKKELKKVVTSIKEITTETSGLAGEFGALGTSINSLTDLQSDFKKEITKTTLKGLELSQSIGDMNGQTKDSYKQALENGAAALEVVTSLAGLNKEDTIEIAQKQIEYNKYYDGLLSQYSILEKSTDLTQEQKDAIKELSTEIQSAFSNSKKFYNIDEEHEEILKELNEDYKTISKTLKKVTTTAEIFFSSGKNAFGMMLIGAGMVAEKFHEIGREMGYGLGEAVGFKSQMLIASILGEESAEAIKELGKELGDAQHISNGMAADVAMLAYNFKLSGGQAAYLSTAFGELQGKSWETGQNTLQYVSALSKANGVIPSEAMKDIAENSEFMAKFTKAGGKNIADAAIAAAKLGVGLKTAEQMADHLLDYQTSIDDEMEASVLLGKNINLQKARELMYNGKMAEGMEAALEAAGGIEKFGEMDYYQRQAVAKALGVSVAELQKMAAHEENLKGMHGVAAQQYERMASLTHTIGDSIAGKVVGGIGGAIIGAGHLLHTFSLLGVNTKLIGSNIGAFLLKPFSLLGNFIGAAIQKFLVFIGLQKSLAATTAASNAAATTSMLMPFTPPAAVGKKARFMKNAGSAALPAAQSSVGSTVSKEVIKDTTATAGAFNTTSLLKVAGAIALFAAALLLLGMALNQFNTVKTEGYVGAGAAIIALGLALKFAAPLLTSFGTAMMASSEVVVPAILMLMGLGAAVLMVGGGFKLFAEGISSIADSLPTLSKHIGTLVSLYLPILGLATAFGILAFSLMGIGAAGLSALPVLMTLAGIGIGLAALSNFMSGGGSTNTTNKAGTDDPLLVEIRGLRDDMASGKIGVYMDSIKLGQIQTRALKNNKSAQ